MIKTGIYKHFKGNLYEVIGTATHSETMETLVVYVPQYGEKQMWVRPLDNFLSKKEINGVWHTRFAYLGATPENEMD